MASYRLNEEQMFADINDGIAIVINSETGIYYGMNNLGTAVFENLLKGIDTAKILTALQGLAGAPADLTDRFAVFIKTLAEHRLLVAGETANESVTLDATVAANDKFELSCAEYSDAQELLLADPIHEVKPETGWKPTKDALETDKELVAKKEAKVDPKQ
ncbi:MAG: PqqD family protein [Planctomycetota bacterium]|jgi:hypothetical protein|nr:PqqD family protein [Planctomycetota bacterium]